MQEEREEKKKMELVRTEEFLRIKIGKISAISSMFSA
jgi:hypothetical protein